MSASLPAQIGGPSFLEMTEREWDKLVDLAQDGSVVPVVGPELLVAPENGVPTPLYETWGNMLAAQTGIVRPEGARRWTIYDVANLLSQREHAGDVACDINDIVRRPPWPTPEPLLNLARIRDFPLYITTTVDHLMMQAVSETRQGTKVEQIRFVPRGEKKAIDLPNSFLFGGVTGVYWLFGESCRTDGMFAKTEDDLIEYSWSLLDKQYAPETLYRYLQKKTVLLLGCSLPDWLGRFFIHALNGGDRYQELIKIYYVSLNCESGLAQFLNRRKAKVVNSISPVEFVEQLHRRWQARNRGSEAVVEGGATAEAPEFKRGAVFLSYASEDRVAVRAIRDELEASNIDTWLDERKLSEDPGNKYEETIRENIREASFFVPIISRALERAANEPRFVWREWRMAAHAAMEQPPGHNYLKPLVIDDTPGSFVEAPYRELHWTRLRDGRVPPEFIEALSRGIRNVRRAR